MENVDPFTIAAIEMGFLLSAAAWIVAVMIADLILDRIEDTPMNQPSTFAIWIGIVARLLLGALSGILGKIGMTSEDKVYVVGAIAAFLVPLIWGYVSRIKLLQTMPPANGPATPTPETLTSAYNKARLILLILIPAFLMVSAGCASVDPDRARHDAMVEPVRVYTEKYPDQKPTYDDLMSVWQQSIDARANSIFGSKPAEKGSQP